MNETSQLTTSARDRPRRWWHRATSLRGLMIVVLVVGGGVGWWVRQATRHREAVVTIWAAGGFVRFVDEFPSSTWNLWTWPYRYTGVESFREIDWIALGQPQGSATAFAVESGRPTVKATIAAVVQLGSTRTLVLHRYPITGEHLARLTDMRIGELGISGVAALPDDVLDGLARLHRIKSLMILMSKAELPRDIFRAVGELTQLESLTLHRRAEGLGCDDLTPLGRLKNLKSLNLSWLAVDKACLSVLDPLQRLESLNMGGTRVDDAALQRLVASHPDLTDLKLDGRLLTNDGVAAVTRLPRLTTLGLWGDFGAEGKLTDVALATLAKISTLSDLNVTCGRFGPAGLDSLRGLPLDHLGLGSIAPGSEEALARLVAGRTFSRLVLDGPGVTDAILPRLAGSLNRRSVLDLTRSSITDAGAAHLATLPIQGIILNKTALTDTGLATFTAGMAARELIAQGTRITPDGINAFNAVRPNRGFFVGSLDDDD